MLITLDGPSGVGKTTLTALLADKLRRRSLKVTTANTPTKSIVGQLAKNGTYDFRGHALTCLVATDRHHHDTTVVRPAILRGDLVICDRYIPSSLVLDTLDGVSREFVWNIYKPITTPAISFILLGDAMTCLDRAMKRGQYSRFHPKDIEKASQEIRLFEEAINYLDAIPEYPVHPYSIGSNTAEEISDELVEIILSRKG